MSPAVPRSSALSRAVSDAPSALEPFGLSWPGKRAAAGDAESPAAGKLRPMRAASVAWPQTENLVVEGDNLAVLKLLRATHERRIKVAYIDPPYNTGHDGIYVDRFHDREHEEDGARAHARWLSMMYPRLVLAR